MRGQDLNLRPSGYEPDELPDCSTPHNAYEAEPPTVNVPRPSVKKNKPFKTTRVIGPKLTPKTTHKNSPAMVPILRLFSLGTPRVNSLDHPA